LRRRLEIHKKRRREEGERGERGRAACELRSPNPSSLLLFLCKSLCLLRALDSGAARSRVTRGERGGFGDFAVADGEAGKGGAEGFELGFAGVVDVDAEAALLREAVAGGLLLAAAVEERDQRAELAPVVVLGVGVDVDGGGADAVEEVRSGIVVVG